MVWPITGAESYVCETGKSMKAVELAVAQKDGWRKIAITLIDSGEFVRNTEAPENQIAPNR
jgi:hypothetical protein